MRNSPLSSPVYTLMLCCVAACLQYPALSVAQEEVAEPAVANSVARTWRIMPIGDSITEASGSRNSYRRPLWHSLDDAGIDTDFVGSRSGNRDGQVPNPDFDTDHEGHWGWTADQFLVNGRIDNWAQTYVPDVILIHLGTNDIFRGQSVASTINEIGQIIDIVRDANPQVIVFVAQLISHARATRPSLVPFNDAIPGLVASKDSAESPVRVVDQYTGFDATVDTYDSVHPNLSGENKMAQKWFDAMLPLLTEAVNEAPAFTSAPLTDATQAVPYSYTATAEDPDADAITITALQKPDWLILVDNGDGTAALSGTPGNADVGANPVRLEAADPSGLTAEQAFTIDVANVNDAPTFTSAPVTAGSEAVAYSYSVTAEDPDADSILITAPLLPDWLTLDDNSDGTATLSGTPDGTNAGTHAVELQAQEAAPGPGLAAQQSFVITVTVAPEGPDIALIGAATVTIAQGDVYNDAGATASDPQDGDLTAQIIIDNPVDSGVPSTYTVSYSVSDSAGNAASAERTVTVRAESTTTVGQQSDSGGGAAGVLELLALFAAAAAGCRPQRRVS